MRRITLALIALLLIACPAAATVSSQVNKITVLGTGSQTAFIFPFIGVSAAYITVLYTDAGGNQTTLTQGSGTTQYQITLNPPVPGATWGLGGTVTYNPSGTPIAAGTTLTIVRTLPLTQQVSLANAGSLATLGNGTETGLDTGVMQTQQVNEQIGRSIVANIANSAPPAPLPPAAQLANQGICGDSTGLNLIGCALPASGVISTAMQPVVNAATLAAGRLAFGLGSMSQENLSGGTCGGASIQDDGSAGGANGVGFARVVYTVASDAISQSVTCAFHNTQRLATGPITYTLPRASTTLFNGWAFRIAAFSGVITIAPNANDNFAGVASGAAVAIAPGTDCWISTNAASSATWFMDCTGGAPAISASASGNALTLLVNLPALTFRNTTLNSGLPLVATPAATAAVTIPTGATLGTSNSVPFRIWIFAAYNGGTPIIGVATCSSAAAVFPCAAWETIQKTGTAITSGATSGGTLYTSAGTSSDAIRIIGYVDYASGLGTAGTYVSAPTAVQSCLPPFVCKRPGDIVQSVYAKAGTLAITPSAAPNLVRMSAGVNTAVAGATSVITYVRTATTLYTDDIGVSGGATLQARSSIVLLDSPGTAASVTYSVNQTGSAQGPTIELDEIMGALDPANDNPSLPLSRAA